MVGADPLHLHCSIAQSPFYDEVEPHQAPAEMWDSAMYATVPSSSSWSPMASLGSTWDGGNLDQRENLAASKKLFVVQGATADFADTDTICAPRQPGVHTMSPYPHHKSKVVAAASDGTSIDTAASAVVFTSTQRNLGCGRRRAIIVVVVLVAVASAIAIGVGLTIGVGGGSPKSSGSTDNEPVLCLPMIIPIHGTVSGDCNGATLGGICMSACNLGYTPSVTGDARRTCGQDGMYNGTAKTCVPVICPPLTAPKHGQVAGDCDGAYRDMCTSTCDSGYRASVRGDAVRICRQDGVYNGTAKKCVPVTCPPLSAPEHGQVAGDCDGAYGGVCTSTCNPGYLPSMRGDAKRTCRQDGIYSGTGKSCVPVTCPPLSAPEQGQIAGDCNGTYDSTCTLTCNPGFKPSIRGDAMRTCVQRGTYNGTAKTCVPVTCPPLLASENGQIAGDCNGAYGDVCKSTCNIGYTLSVTGDAMRTCAQDGAYNGTAKTCIHVVCPPLSADKNRLITGGCNGTYGDTCIFACNPGYSLSAAGDTARTCGQSGSYNGTAKTCQVITCPPLSAPPYGKVDGNCRGRYGDICASSCDSGYTMSSLGDAVRTCSQDGAYSGRDITCGKVIDDDVDIFLDADNSTVCDLFEGVIRVNGHLNITGNGPGLTRLTCLATLEVGALCGSTNLAGNFPCSLLASAPSHQDVSLLPKCTSFLYVLTFAVQSAGSRS